MPIAGFNPLDPSLRTDPYAVYRALREADPVHWSEIMHVWVLTRYEDVLAVLRDHTNFSSNRLLANNPMVQQMEQYRQASGPLGRTPTMLSSDPPAHTRMRNLANKAFSPRVVESSRAHIQEIADSLFDSLADPRCLDVITDLAVPLPVIVIAEVLGVPASDREQFKAWSADIANSLAGPFLPPAALQRAQRSANEIADYFGDQVRMRRKQPRDDLLSALMSAEEQGDLLNEDELLATCILLLVAGNETTTNLIGNGLLALLQNPAQLRLLQSQPALLATAVDEILRFDSPAQMTVRVVTREIEFGGRKMQPGQVVLAVLAAANRDPRQFVGPDQLNIRRTPNRHLAFGLGIHYCLGAPLAVAEAQTAIATFLRRLPAPVAGFETPDWSASFILRGLKSLPVVSA